MYLFGRLLIYFQCVTTFCLLFVFFSPFFRFLFIFPAARTNPMKVVDKKQSALVAIAIGNSFLHKHQLLLLILALVGLTLSNPHCLLFVFCFLFCFFPFPIKSFFNWILNQCLKGTRQHFPYILLIDYITLTLAITILHISQESYLL